MREIGGYRIVRTLASSRHATRLLVHADGTAWVARVFAPDCPDAVVDHEVAVSDVVRSSSGAVREHVSAAHDLCTTDDGRIVIIEPYLAGPRLDTLVRSRYGTLTLGEAVTLLAPLAGAVEAGHQLGITGLLSEPAAVRLAASGAPIITRRSTVRLGPALPDRFRDREPRYAADRDAVERVGAAVAAALSGDEQAALLGALQRRGSALDLALFDLAAPQPVRYDVGLAPVPDPPALPATAVSAIERAAASSIPEFGGASESTPLPLLRLRRALSTTLASLGLPASLVSTVENAGVAVARHVARGEEWARRFSSGHQRAVRPRFIVAGAVGGAALMAAIIVAGASATGEIEHDDAPREPVHAPSAVSGGAGVEPGLAESELHPAPDVWPALVDELLERWSDCAPVPVGTGDARDSDGGSAETSSTDCAAAVVHEGSAAAALIAAADPRHDLVRAWLRGQGEVVVVERMGAAVLLDLITDSTTTASLLVVRSEAGWRIRDVIG